MIVFKHVKGNSTSISTDLKNSKKWCSTQWNKTWCCVSRRHSMLWCLTRTIQEARLRTWLWHLMLKSIEIFSSHAELTGYVQKTKCCNTFIQSINNSSYDLILNIHWNNVYWSSKTYYSCLNKHNLTGTWRYIFGIWYFFCVIVVSFFANSVI